MKLFHVDVVNFRSTDSQYLNASSNYVRSLGITTYAVGVGEANVQELKVLSLFYDIQTHFFQFNLLLFENRKYK